MNSSNVIVSEILDKARTGDSDSINSLFSGFLSKDEEIIDCGYLGVLGYVLPEYSFWCITKSRVCGLLVRRGGRVQFTSGFIKLINSMSFKQPSLVFLWLLIIFWILLLWLAGFFSVYLFDFLFGMDFPNWLSITFPLMLGVIFLRWFVRAYYRLVKSGCTFWMRESRPVYLFADRNNLVNSQRLLSKFTYIKDKFNF